MRRRILTIVLAALVLAVVVPLGAAWTLDRRLPLPGHAFTRRSVPAPAVPGQVTAWAEAGSLALTGGVLLGLSAAVRRAG